MQAFKHGALFSSLVDALHELLDAVDGRVEVEVAARPEEAADDGYLARGSEAVDVLLQVVEDALVGPVDVRRQRDDVDLVDEQDDRHGPARGGGNEGFFRAAEARAPRDAAAPRLTSAMRLLHWMALVAQSPVPSTRTTAPVDMGM